MTDKRVLGPVSRVSRRAFLEGSAAIGLGAAIGPASLTGRAVAVDAPRLINAAHWGVMRAVVENGKFVKALPFEKDPAPVLPMIEATPSLVYSPSRVKYPMVRKGFLEKGAKSDTKERGTGDFVRVSWEQALDLVVRELKRVKSEFGPAAFFVGDLGWKSSGRMQNPRAALAALMNLHGGYSAPLGDYSTGAAQAILPRVMGNLEVYAPQSAWPGVVEAAEMLVVWGADPMVTLREASRREVPQGLLRRLRQDRALPHRRERRPAEGRRLGRQDCQHRRRGDPRSRPADGQEAHLHRRRLGAAAR